MTYTVPQEGSMQAPENRVREMFQPPEPGGALTRPPSFLTNDEPVWKRLHADQKDLLKSKSPGLTDRELAQAVELAAAYGLDPYANEIWFAKGKPRHDGTPGKLLIMVGRDGLRKVVQREGCEAMGDVVHTNDVFSVALIQNGYDLVRHGILPEGATLEYADQAFRSLGGGYPLHHVTHRIPQFDRGPILGAWCRTYERKTMVERGFFVAPLAEYHPGDVKWDSPWKKTASVMILAAAERQAYRMSTPLGGLLAEGEDEVVNSTAVELSAGQGDGSEPGWSDALEPADVAMLELAIARARLAEHAGLADRGTIQMHVTSRERAEEWLANADAVLGQMEVETNETPDSADPDTMERAAADLQAQAENLDEGGYGVRAAETARLAQALHVEAEKQRSQPAANDDTIPGL